MLAYIYNTASVWYLLIFSKHKNRASEDAGYQDDGSNALKIVGVL